MHIICTLLFTFNAIFKKNYFLIIIIFFYGQLLA